MSLLETCPKPANVNPLSPNGFMFNIARIPELAYFCQDIVLPSVSLPGATIVTPFVNYAMPGDNVDYSDLQVTFQVDSNMNNYVALFEWLRGVGFTENNPQYTAQTMVNAISASEASSVVSDATLTILGLSNTPIRTIEFVDCFPSSLDSLTFTTTSQDVQYLTCGASFRYSYFRFV